MQAEYKQVTVLFADVVRSMDIAVSVDLERLREIIMVLVERSAAVIRRFGGTVDFIGDGVMAIFGAPLALEDHAFRGCLAALAIQHEAGRLAAEIQSRDGVQLQLRVGLNSGRVIAGSLGAGTPGYTAIGEAVGFAQRMESVAPPGGVLVSESTARLVEHVAMLGDPEWVYVKGADAPVCTRRLTGIGARGVVRRAEAGLVGRQREMATLDAAVDRAISGRGCVLSMLGPAGIGKSRVAREAAQRAAARGVEVFTVFCESHAREIPLQVFTQLLRVGCGIDGLDDEGARAVVRQRVPGADPSDVLLLDDLLGIADPEVALPQSDPEVRRRRLLGLMDTAALARTEPALLIIEDAHWIDAASETMLDDFLAVVPRTRMTVLIVARPEYAGVLTRNRDGGTIALAPLSDNEIAALIAEMLGPDPSVRELATTIMQRAAGNPFFAEEMVRELIQRGALTGSPGGYVCGGGDAEYTVPATVQATIEARIDRLTTQAKQTLNAASVIGMTFGADLLSALGIEPDLDELVRVELIDQAQFAPDREYTFRHPLIRSVAYEAQLSSERAQWHRLLAAVVQERAAGSVDEHAAMIAEHLQAAGDLLAAYGWHMRAAARAAVRDIGAARLSWQRADGIVDELPGDESARLPMRIAPRTMLYVTNGLDSAMEDSAERFAELREWCTAADDKVSLAMAMSGRSVELLYSGRSREGAQLASEQMALLESIGRPDLTLGLSFIACCNFVDRGDFDEMLRWSQTVVDLAGGDPVKGAGFGIGSPLAVGLAFRSTARWWCGHRGWYRDLTAALEIVRDGAPDTRCAIAAWTYGAAFQYGVLRADDQVLRELEEIVRLSESGTVVGQVLALFTLAAGLLNRQAAADRERGVQAMERVRELVLQERAVFLAPVADVWIAGERARRGELDQAISVLGPVVDELHRAGRNGYGIWATGVLAETLLGRGGPGDLPDARTQIAWLADLSTGQDSAIVRIMLLRLRALLARAEGDPGFRELVRRYRAMAQSLGFEGHLDSAARLAE